MLQFLMLPAVFQPVLDVRVVGVVRAEVGRIGVRAGLDKGGAHQQVEHVLVLRDRSMVDMRIVNVGQPPVVPGGNRLSCILVVIGGPSMYFRGCRHSTVLVIAIAEIWRLHMAVWPCCGRLDSLSM